MASWFFTKKIQYYCSFFGDTYIELSLDRKRNDTINCNQNFNNYWLFSKDHIVVDHLALVFGFSTVMNFWGAFFRETKYLIWALYFFFQLRFLKKSVTVGELTKLAKVCIKKGFDWKNFFEAQLNFYWKSGGERIEIYWLLWKPAMHSTLAFSDAQISYFLSRKKAPQKCNTVEKPKTRARWSMTMRSFEKSR